MRVDGPQLGDWPHQWYGRNVGDGSLMACAAYEDGIGFHLSISHRTANGRPGRYPTWDEIADARDVLLPAEVSFVMVLPAADDYVSLHDTTFHLHEEQPANTPLAVAARRVLDAWATEVEGSLPAIEQTALGNAIYALSAVTP